VLQHDLLARLGEVGLCVLDFEALYVDAALGDADLEDIQHLPELKLLLRAQADRGLLEHEFRFRALEVEALLELTVRLVDGIGEFMPVDFRYDVEGRHGGSPGIPAMQAL
jgi:hypothetical protein